MTGIVILAAGASTRLKQPKQHLQYKGKTLLQHTIDEALQSQCKPIVLVTGYQHEIIQQTIKNPGVIHAVNEAWESGMGSSISTGLQTLLRVEPSVQTVVFVLCDQPFINHQVIDELVSTYQSTNKGIIASAYKNTVGVPMLFSSQHFNELLQLSGQEGAKPLLRKHVNDIAIVPFERGGVDIDTLADYQALLDGTEDARL